MARARLAMHEQRILSRLTGVEGVPRPIGFEGERFYRTWIEGRPVYEARDLPPEFWDALLALVGEIHQAGVAHDDLAKEANVLVTPDGRPAVIDFQVAALRDVVGDRVFEWLCREDRRHVLKHKRVHCLRALRPSEECLLANKSLPVRIWQATAMRPWQCFVIALGWEPRSGPEGR